MAESTGLQDSIFPKDFLDGSVGYLNRSTTVALDSSESRRIHAPGWSKQESSGMNAPDNGIEAQPFFRPLQLGCLDNGEDFNGGFSMGRSDFVVKMNQEVNLLTSNGSGIPNGYLNAFQHLSSSEVRPQIGQQDRQQMGRLSHVLNASGFSNYENLYKSTVPSNCTRGSMMNSKREASYSRFRLVSEEQTNQQASQFPFEGRHSGSGVFKEPSCMNLNSSNSQLLQHQTHLKDQSLKWFKIDVPSQNPRASNSSGPELPESGEKLCHGAFQNQFPQQHLISQSPSSYQQNHFENDPSNACHSMDHQFMPNERQTLLSQNKISLHPANHLCVSTAELQRGAPKQGVLEMHMNGICMGTYQSQSAVMTQHGSEDVSKKSVPSNGGPLNVQFTGSMKCHLSKASSSRTHALEKCDNEEWKCVNVEWLVFLHHGNKCSASASQCSYCHCGNAQKIWMHISSCKGVQCPLLLCQPLRKLWGHYCCCSDQACLICGCVRRVTFLHKASFNLPSNSRKVDITRSSKQNIKSEPLGDVQYPLKRNRVHSSTAQYLPEPVSDPEQEKPSVQIGEPAFVGLVDSSLTSANGNPGSQMENGIDPTWHGHKIPSFQLPEDLQSPMKRMKVEHSSTKYISLEPLTPTSEVCDLGQVKASGQVKEPVVDQDEDTSMKMGSSLTFSHENPGSKMENGLEHTSQMKGGVSFTSSGELASQVTNEDCTEVDKCRMEVNQKSLVLRAVHEEGTAQGKQKIRGASLLEYFTQEQIRIHIKALRQFIGLTKAKAEQCQAMQSSSNQSSCQLCCMGKLSFAPDVYCNLCGLHVKRDAIYYTTSKGKKPSYFCPKCFHGARGECIEVEGCKVPKSSLDKKNNVCEIDEEWVQCDGCKSWNHQICALFNKRKNDSRQAEYTCPYCYLKQVEGGERKPLPQSTLRSAKDLPTTILSDHLEQRLFRRLKWEREERARILGKNFDEVPGAEDLVIRVVSSVDKKLQVNQQFLEIIKDNSYPTEFPYKSKVILLFQKIESIDVCLFCVYVQEYGSECPYPNNRRVCISYLDSVKYFQPNIKATTEEPLRTFVYQEILVGYLEYCKSRGFVSCSIWACPPRKGDDYILYCHPEIQKSPKLDRLRQWYLDMILKATNDNIVVENTNMYEQFFLCSGEKKAKVTMSRVPYFEGDYFTREAEYIIANILKEEDSKRLRKSGKRPTSKVAPETQTQAAVANDASKEALVMQKLGVSICKTRSDFILIHMQCACTHCGQFVLSGKLWVCNPCKNICLCENCYDAERKLAEKDRHPSNKRGAHALSLVEVDDVPLDTKDRDEILESDVFHTQQTFLCFCVDNHFQFDTLRRAKHSSMMILDYLHNPMAPVSISKCNICNLDIEEGKGWHCETLKDYAICEKCFQRDGGENHCHQLKGRLSVAKNEVGHKEQDLLRHSARCRVDQCQYSNCVKFKELFRNHANSSRCKVRKKGGCLDCLKMWRILGTHARGCRESGCDLPRCRDLKEFIRSKDQQSESQGRSTVMEMTSNQASLN
ncbi:histone acetyltransferase HAC1 isoform X1 [Amborella trichopoda]|uniref:histone acetyltransferase HAC1 isoform X1 n=1 Tax=Amborella trichopoda TaxID=13333 RepID=UPI0009C07D8E|nr:histone acetyltransferase HAC1 isoform X1 [Amborella trichopoda]|eukprot:XP_020519887.1 histone acetyltransferase HAC1 isoform X1 [Amborella trichopoda]